jgi:CheY-like chemotaxis protein
MQPGLGLGLAITRVLARRLGGEVTVSSEVARGSSFRLQMLLPEPMTAPTGAAVDRRLIGYKGQQKTILVIDDNPSQFVVVQHLLRPLNFAVFAATNGTEGLALAERCSPDLILLDIQMPDYTGWEIAAQLRTTFGRGLRIVMVSANAHEFRAGGDGQSNHDAFLSKPVDLNALLEVIGRQLDLDWIAADDDIPEVNQRSAVLPKEAGPYLESMRHYVKMGHVRAIETLLTELETAVPDSAGAVMEMRRLLSDYDLRALARRLDHVD